MDSVKNHGIPDDLIDKTVEAGKDFFALPESVKMEVVVEFLGFTHFIADPFVNSDGHTQNRPLQRVHSSSG